MSVASATTASIINSIISLVVSFFIFISHLNRWKTVENFDESGIIEIGKSVGAMAKNYDVLLPNGTYSKLTEGTQITDIEVFAGIVEMKVKGWSKKWKYNI